MNNLSEVNEVKSLLRKAFDLDLKENGHEEAIGILDKIVKKYGNRTEIELEQLVAEGLVSKGFMLGNWFFRFSQKIKTPEETMAKINQSLKTFDEVVIKFGKRNEPELACKVAAALWQKGHVYEKINQFKDAFISYEQVFERYGDRKEFELETYIALALCDMGNILLGQNNLEGALEIFEETSKKFGNRKEKDLSEPVAESLYGKGVIYGKNNRYEDALKIFDELILKFSSSEYEFRVGPVSKALLDKGITHCKLGQYEQALKTFDKFIKKYGTGKFSPVFRELVDQARINKRAIALKNNFDRFNGTNPELNAKALKIAKETGKSPVFVFDNVKKIDGKSKNYGYWVDVVNNFPGTSEFLEKPENMAISYDDLENLFKHEQTYKDFSESVNSRKNSSPGLPKTQSTDKPHKESTKGILGGIFSFFSSKPKEKQEKNYEESEVIRDFGKEVSAWPSDQARLGLEMFKSLMAGEVDGIEERFSKIQLRYFNVVVETFKKYVEEIKSLK